MTLQFAERLELSTTVDITTYGRCYRCHLPWDLVRLHGGQTHSTHFKRSSGLFPLCCDCWQELSSPEARLPYYRALFLSWRRICGDDSEDPDLSDETWNSIESAVRNGL